MARFCLFCICFLLSIYIGKGQIKPHLLHSPLQPISADSIFLTDFYWKPIQKIAHELIHKTTVPPLKSAKYSFKRLQKEHLLWQKRTNDSLNIIGGVGNRLESKQQLFDAINTFNSSLPLFLNTANATYFEAIDYAIYNALRGGLSTLMPDSIRKKACLTFLQSLNYMFCKREPNELYINFYASSITSIPLNKGAIIVDVDTSFPWVGFTRISIKSTNKTEKIKVYLRCPLWLQNKTLFPNRLSFTKKEARFKASFEDQTYSINPSTNYIEIEYLCNSEKDIIIEMFLPVQHLYSPLDKQKEKAEMLHFSSFVYGFTQPLAPYLYNPNAPVKWFFDKEKRKARLLHAPLLKTDSNSTKPVHFLAAPYYILKQERADTLFLWSKLPQY